MLPESTKKVPAMAFSSVDFPEPLVPITITKEPSSIKRSTFCRDRTSFGVPALNVLDICRVSSMGGRPRFLCTQFGQQIRKDQGQEHKYRRDELQVIRIQTPAQGDGHQQPEQ